MTARQSNIDSLYPLTPVQEGILYHSLLEDRPGPYIQQFSCRLLGSLDVGRFRRAWDLVIDRHQALRSMIVWEGRDNPLQLVRTEVQPVWKLEDVSALPQAQRESRIGGFLAADKADGIALDMAPLMRFALFRESDSMHRFAWTHHHLVIDGWSISLVLDEVFELYGSLGSGEEPNRTPGPQFRAFVDHLRGRDRADAQAYWTSYLDGFTPNRLETSETEQLSPWASSQSETSIDLTRKQTAGIDQFARTSELTLSDLLRGAWAIVVSRYSGDTDITFGATTSGRPYELAESMGTVGLFINTVPVRVRLDDHESTALDLLRRIQDDQITMSGFDWTPLPEIQDWTDVKGGQPLFSSVVVVENLARPSGGPGLEIVDDRYEQQSNYPLALLAFPGDRLQLKLLYDPYRFGAAVAGRMLSQFAQTLLEFVRSPTRSLAELDYFSEEELRAILENSIGDFLPEADSRITSRIAKAAAASPATPAVICGDTELSYEELLRSSNELADVLFAMGFGSEPSLPVAVSIRRSAAMVVAIMGVLLAGGTYVPLDPDLPPRRRDEILSDTGAIALLTLPETHASVGIPEIQLDGDGRLLGWSYLQHKEPVAPRTDALHMEDLAYVMYTSGSTGSPKGVAVSHRSLAHSTSARDEVYAAPPSTYLMTSPFFFDSSVAGVFWTLASGGTLVLPEHGQEQDVAHLVSLVAQHRVSHLLTLPTLYKLMLDIADSAQLSTLELAIVAGEPCPPDLVAEHHAQLPGTELANEYGPTEATVWSTVHMTRPGDETRDRTPIGRPIPGSEVFVLDSQLRPAPVGVRGEIYLGGTGLAVGYHNDQALTKERFLAVDLPLKGETRLYRTGDLARYADDGLLTLVGRTDDQIKIRGRRIEPREPETVMSGHPEVDVAAVVAVGDNETTALAGFFVSKSDSLLDGPALRRYLEERLPAYLVPTHIVGLAVMPTNANGKVDRKALHMPDAAPRREPDLERELTESESLVIGFARDLIGYEGVRITDHFFDVGGHSLLSMQLIARIYTETGVHVSPNVVLFNSLAYVAAHIDEPAGEAARTSERAPVSRLHDDQPVRFGRRGDLFGFLHRPSESSEPGWVVVICPPFGWEYYKTHKALRDLARRSLEAGHSVFRFDYYGTGDSLGDPGQATVEKWIGDVADAVEFAREQTDLTRVALVGLRLGALLAFRANRGQELARKLILWDPVISGAEHIESLTQLHSRFFSQKDPKTAARLAGDSLLGSNYPDGLRSGLRKLDLQVDSVVGPGETHVVLSSPDREKRVRVALPGLAHLDVVDDAGGWNDLATFNSALLPNRIPRHIAELIAGRS